MRVMTPLAFGAAVLILAQNLASAMRLRAGGAGAGAGTGSDAAGVDFDNTVHHGERTRRIEVRKPLTDKREYLHTTFDSGLRVLAVNDPDAEHSSFAVAVEAGSLEDPADFQGLAHFCEHMLFLGSDKYPDKDAFSMHLAKYGGNHNAYTSAENTVYFNEIGNDGFDKGLDIFAQFFISPLFDKSMVDKEVNAVDSEHKKNMPDTQRRLWHLLRSKANPKNPMHQFSTGDLETLKTKPEMEGKSLVKALEDFHKINYCPGRLHLVLISNTSTSELLDIGHKHFDLLNKVSKTCSPRPVYATTPAYSMQLGNLGRHFTVGTTGSPQMWLTFPMPPLQQEYKKLAEAYLWNALGNYGEGSLKALLLKEDLSQSYSYSSDSSVAASEIKVTFDLTEKGAQNTDQVLEYLFAYLNAVKAAGIDMKLFDGMRQLRQVQFDYGEKQASEFDFVSSLAGALPQYPPQDALTGGVLIDQPDAYLIKRVLDSIVPTNMNVAIVTPAFDEKKAHEHEQYYDFGYDEAPLDPALILRLGKASRPGFVPPPEMKYVPRNLTLTQEGAGEGGPEELIKRDRVHLWWLGMGDVKLPKAIVSIKLSFPPALVAKAQDSIIASVHTRLVQMALEKPTDMLQTCGLSYSVSSYSDGLGISFSGFDEHLEDLIKLVLPSIREPSTSEEDFEMVRRQLMLDIADVTRSQPYQHAMQAYELVTMQGQFSRFELEQAASSKELVNMDTHKQLLEQIFAQARLTFLISGNMGRNRAISIANIVEEDLKISKEKIEVTGDGHMLVVNPREEIDVRLANPIKGDPNHATLVAYQFGVPTIAERVIVSMLGAFIERPVFEALRTERQLGYVVFGYAAPHDSIVEFRVLVQGFREKPDVVADLIEGVVQNLTEHIEHMSAEDFASRKKSLRISLSKKPATMGQYAGRYWSQIWNDNYCFRKLSMQLKYLDSEEFSTPAPLLKVWKQAVAPPTGHRKKVVVKLFGSTPGQTALPQEAAHTGAKVITLADAAPLGKDMEDEPYWPNKYICE